MWAIDFSAFKWGTGSDYCLTPAYAFLIPAYSALWLSGFWYARHYQFSLQTLLPLMTSVFVGALLCELISSGSFYLLSGYFSQPSVTEFIGREMVYFPAYLLSMVFYIALAALIHIIFAMAKPAQTNTKTS